MNSSALKYLDFLDTGRLDEFFDHTGSRIPNSGVKWAFHRLAAHRSPTVHSAA